MGGIGANPEPVDSGLPRDKQQVASGMTTDFGAILDYSWRMNQEEPFGGVSSGSKLSWICESILQVDTYEDEHAAFFAKKALEVMQAISTKTTFDYIRDEDNHRWYLILCNLPFFRHRITWGTSIRGAWWIHGPITLDAWDLVWNREQLGTLTFKDREAWEQFIAALIAFAGR